MTTQFTPEFLAEQRKLAEKATPRPWAGAGRPPCLVTNPSGPDHEVVLWAPDSNVEGQHDNWNDIWYVQNAANHYPAALDEIERLQQVNAELLAVLEKVEKACKATGNYIGQNGQLIKEVRAAITRAKGTP
jgi:hypothetical protein